MHQLSDSVFEVTRASPEKGVRDPGSLRHRHVIQDWHQPLSQRVAHGIVEILDRRHRRPPVIGDSIERPLRTLPMPKRRAGRLHFLPRLNQREQPEDAVRDPSELVVKRALEQRALRQLVMPTEVESERQDAVVLLDVLDQSTLDGLSGDEEVSVLAMQPFDGGKRLEAHEPVRIGRRAKQNIE
jgi:hypothetical protein